MRAILSADSKWGIGKGGRLLVRIPSDMRFFRDTTYGNTVIVGRKTLEGFPGGMPLEGRDNIILTRNPHYRVKGAAVVHSIDELMSLVSDLDTDKVFVCGGGIVYRELLPFCDMAIVTRIDYNYDADTFFPDLDKAEDWLLAEVGEEQTCRDIIFRFQTYRRVKKYTV